MKRTAFFLALALLFHASPAAADSGAFISSLLKLPVPPEVTFLGERVPLEKEDVAERIDLELIVALGNPVSTTLWFKRSARFFPLIEKKIKEMGLPMDLRFVPVVESNLRAEARSSARAVGPWQFIRSTGRMYGLKGNSWKDDRRHWEEATDAGLRHLKDLRGELGSWPLALAAYNAGKRRVSNAMSRQGEDNFYGLVLPTETERYVFRILAAKLILENPEDYGISLDGSRLYPPEDVVGLKLKVRRARLPVTVIASSAGVSYRRLKRLNAWITGDHLPKGSHDISIPASSKGTFDAELARWEKANPEPKVVYYRVRKGDTLSAIAQRHNVRLNDLLAWNSLGTRSIIRPGQKLAVKRVN